MSVKKAGDQAIHRQSLYGTTSEATCATAVCGGLSTYQATAILRKLAGIDVIGMDVVEVAPAYDVGEITALAGATVAMEMVCLYASAGRVQAETASPRV